MNSTNYNSLVKLAADPIPQEIPQNMLRDLKAVPPIPQNYLQPRRPATQPQYKIPESKPKTYPVVNPATGGTRVMYKGKPIGPVVEGHSIRQGSLPITPYSSGQIDIGSIQQANRQANNIQTARIFNHIGKQYNAQNLDAMFKRLHETNQQRRIAGLPDYTPQVLDLYAPYANSKTDYSDAENRLTNDTHLSTIAQEAARRGTPMNEAELELLYAMMPRSYKERKSLRNLPQPYIENMGLKLPNLPENTSYMLGQKANGVFR